MVKFVNNQIKGVNGRLQLQLDRPATDQFSNTNNVDMMNENCADIEHGLLLYHRQGTRSYLKLFIECSIDCIKNTPCVIDGVL